LPVRKVADIGQPRRGDDTLSPPSETREKIGGGESSSRMRPVADGSFQGARLVMAVSMARRSAQAHGDADQRQCRCALAAYATSCGIKTTNLLSADTPR